MTGVYYRLKYYLPFLLLIIVFLGSCGSYKKSTLFNSKYDVLADTSKTIYVANAQSETSSDYLIQPGDRIIVKNLQDPKIIADNTSPFSPVQNLSTTGYLVEQDGQVLLPVIGKFKIDGLNKDQARLLIEKEYEKNLLKNPIIDISVINFSVTVLGEFIQQGKFYLEKENTNLVELLGLVKGVNPNADITKLKIIRGDLKNPEIIYVNLNDINSLANNKIIIQNKDILYLPTKKNSYNSEELKKSAILVQTITTFINTILIIYTLTR